MLPIALRLYIYGLHGFLIEVTFTAIWDFVLTQDFKLKGCSSLWSFIIYGTCGLFLEKCSKLLLQNSLPIWLRGLIYLFIVYAWEFSWGGMLSLVNACSWDYSDFTYNLYGLITLEYAAFWMVAGLIAERFLLEGSKAHLN